MKLGKKKVSKNRHKSIQTQLAQAGQLYQQRQWGATIDICQKLLADNPNHAETLNLLALTALEVGDMNTALALIRQAIAADGKCTAYYTNAAVILQRQGDLAQAAAMLKQAVALDASLVVAGLDLARLQLTIGDIDQADAVCDKLLISNATNEDVWFISGLCKSALEQHEKSKEAFEKVLVLNPNHLDAINNLAAIDYNLKSYNQAERMYTKGFELSPLHSAMQLGLAKSQMRQLRMGEAEIHLKKILEREPANSEVRWQLSNLYQITQQFNVWHSFLEASLAITGLEASIYEKLKVQQAMLCWIMGNYERCAEVVSQSKIASFLSQEDRDARNGWAYWLFLGFLVEYRKQHVELYRGEGVPLHMVGDSHTLSYTGTVQTIAGKKRRLVAHLVVGCKAWHLAKAELVGGYNQYRYAFEKAVDQVPDGEEVVFCFGEIDCRANEGFIKVWQKDGIDPKGSIEETVCDYVAYVMEHCVRKKLKPFFYGVPAPARDLSLLDQEGIRMLTGIICQLNKTLSDEVRERGAAFIDPYHLTSVIDGYSDGSYHLDDHHLKPEVLAKMPIASRVDAVEQEK